MVGWAAGGGSGGGPGDGLRRAGARDLGDVVD